MKSSGYVVIPDRMQNYQCGTDKCSFSRPLSGLDYITALKSRKCGRQALASQLTRCTRHARDTRSQRTPTHETGHKFTGYCLDLELTPGSILSTWTQH